MHHVHHTDFPVYMILMKQTAEIQGLLVNTVCFHLSLSFNTHKNPNLVLVFCSSSLPHVFHDNKNVAISGMHKLQI